MFLLEIRDDELIYRSLFQRRKLILSGLKEVVRKIDLVSHGNRPPNRLEIRGIQDGKSINFDVNMKVFSPQDAKEIESALKVVR